MPAHIRWCFGAAVFAPLAFAASTGSGIVYTCDASVTAVAPQACVTLNTTIAGLYSAAFTNANANIYVTMGEPGADFVSTSYAWFIFYSYSAFRTALATSASSSNDFLALSHLPATSPYGTSLVELSSALQRALGFPVVNGVTSTGASCNSLGSAGCYDGLVTLNGEYPLYFRTGPITSGEYDFYTAVQHETDEILGALSCAFTCTGRIMPIDLYRYHSDGTRSFAAGTNAACSSSNSTNACLSLDGMNMLQQYNNIDNGLDPGDWNPNCLAQHVQEAYFCPGTAGTNINLSAEILELDAIGYTVQPFVPSGPYNCTNTAQPFITSVNSASAYGGYPYFASGSWLEIYGSGLADPNDPRLTAAVNPAQWTSADFNGVNAPTALDGVSASIDGAAAYVWYISPGQVNVQAPEDSVTGSVAITVTNCQGQSPAYPLTLQPLAPGMLAPANFTANGNRYMVATFTSDGAYVLDPAFGASLGVTSRPAKAGDLIIAYGIGFGGVTPAILPGVIAEQANNLTNPVSFSFGSAAAALPYSGLAPAFVGLYEFYITVPAGLANGDNPIHVMQNGNPLPQNLYLTIQN